MSREHRARVCGWLLVAGQVLLLGGLGREGLRQRGGRARGVIGAGLFALGTPALVAGARQLGPALSAHPAPAAEAVLRVDGLYRLVRHPIYSGVLLCALGAALVAGTRRGVCLFVSLVVLLNMKARFEERLLAERFPEYEAYASRTPRFVPRAVRPR